MSANLLNLSAQRPCCQARAQRRSAGVACRAQARGGPPKSAPGNPKSPVGIHSQVWVGGWSPKEAEHAISGTKDAGYDLIELNVSEPDKFDAAMTKELLQKYGIKGSGSLGLSKATDISSSDSSIRHAGKELLSNSMKILRDVGGKYFVGVNFCAMDKYTTPCSTEQWNTCRDSLKELCKEAADYGLIYGLEVVNRYETNILNTAAQAMDMVADVGADNVVVHLDTYHMNIEEASVQRAVKLCGDKLGYVHVGESHRGYLGTGSVNWDGLWSGLAEMGYEGPITFESFSSAVVSDSLSRTLCIWRDPWVDSRDLAFKARTFIDANLKASLASLV
ncbi:hypothetical protein WJX73_006466 [Symbiochloris irregularis]|uniref:Xylose isomerase-like TIM barrel domain-containing protein n=1 Tax=Symbiochloris irregularis TaxID=706552 RepID=A0AAW1NQH2_9CHLO